MLVSVKSSVPRADDRVIVCGVVELKSVGSNRIVFGLGETATGVGVGPEDGGPQSPAAERVGCRGDQVHGADFIGADVDRGSVVDLVGIADRARWSYAGTVTPEIVAAPVLTAALSDCKAIVSVGPPLLARPAVDRPAETPIKL